MVDVALHEPLEAVLDAEHLDALEQRADGRRADDAVDAGRRAAADEDRELLSLAHRIRSLLGMPAHRTRVCVSLFASYGASVK